MILFFFFFWIPDLYFMIPAVIAQIFIVAAEPVILIAMQSKEAEREIKLKS